MKTGLGIAVASLLLWLLSPILGPVAAGVVALVVFGVVLLSWKTGSSSADKANEANVESRPNTRADEPPDQVASTPRDDPPELEPAIEALRGEHYDLALQLAGSFADAEKTALAIDAHNVCALSLSRLGRYGEAAPHWQAMFEVKPTAFLALQVASSLVVAGDLPNAESWLERSDAINADSREMSSALIRSNFISALEQAGRCAEAFPHVEWLKGGYETLQITDDHFLHMRGMPFLSVFLERSLPIVRTALPATEVPGWYRSMCPRLDEEGASRVEAFLTTLTLARSP